MLPVPFIQKMKTLLKAEFEAFIKTYEEERAAGVRIHPLKISKEKWETIAPFSIEKIPFVENGYYYSYTSSEPGKHPYHFAGVYYIQEPSAMFVAQLLDVTEEDIVLDLCASPGGKSTQIATMMNNKGLLIANEIHPKRAKVLSENVERFGLKNTVVLNETSKRLAKVFPSFFSKILVDAPCSGEGMFRKDEEARIYWSQNHVEQLSEQQKVLLDDAYEMLQPGGILVYSTCTFSPEENEQVIEYFLNKHEDMELVAIEKMNGIDDGRVEWTKNGTSSIEKTARLWPHKLKGEGHFAAKLRKGSSSNNQKSKLKQIIVPPLKNVLKDYKQFEETYITNHPSFRIQMFGNHLYHIPDNCPELKGLKVVRWGLHLGELKKNRFEPNHALALYLTEKEFNQTYTLSSHEDEWKRFVKGETLKGIGNKGWTLVTVDGFPIGWGKETNGILKNYYPKGLRIQPK